MSFLLYLEYNKYKYYVVDFDAQTETADIYYELVEGTAGPQTQSDVQLNVTVVKPSEQNSYVSQVVIKFFDIYYHLILNLVLLHNSGYMDNIYALDIFF